MSRMLDCLQGGWPVVLEGSQACGSCDRHRGQEGRPSYRSWCEEGCSCCWPCGKGDWPWHQEGGSCDWPCHQEGGSSYRPRYQEGGPCSWSYGQEGRSRSEDGDVHCVQLQHGQADCRCHQACRQDYLEVGEEERRSHEGGNQAGWQVDDLQCQEGRPLGCGGLQGGQ